MKDVYFVIAKTRKIAFSYKCHTFIRLEHRTGLCSDCLDNYSYGSCILCNE